MKKTVILFLFVLISISLTSYANLNNGLVAYYSFDDLSDLGYDSSSYANNGVAQGGVGSADGILGKAASFDGINDYISVPNDESLNFTNTYTIAAWVKPDVTNSNRAIVSKWADYPNDQRAYRFTIIDGQILQTVNWDSQTRSQPGIIETGKWIHLAVVGDGTYNSLYMNGQQVTTVRKDTYGALNQNSGIMAIGAQSGDLYRWFKGLIDEVKLWDRALSADEVAEEAGLELIMYDLSLKGKTISLKGKKAKFNATGSLGWNNTTGRITYEAKEESGVFIKGSGTLCSDKLAIAVTIINIGSADGNAVFLGKFTDNNAKFKGRINGGIANLSGVSSNETTYIIGKIIATMK